MVSAGKVESTVPRAKAVFHAALATGAFLLGPRIAPYLLAFTGAAMAISVIAGPRFSLFGRLYVQVLKPALNISDGKMEDATPHRFAEGLGAIFLLAASASYAAGAHGAGEGLALIVAGLAWLNALAGICIGCQMYLLFKRTQSGGAM